MLSAMRGVFSGRNPNEQGTKSASNNGSITNFTAICTTRSFTVGVAAVTKLLFDLAQEPRFAIFPNLVNIHVIHARCTLIGLHPLPGLLQDVLPTDLIVEKREPPFRLLLGHSV